MAQEKHSVNVTKEKKKTYGSWNGKAAMRRGMTLGLKKKYGIYVSAFNVLSACPFFSRQSRSREAVLSHCILHRRDLSAIFVQVLYSEKVTTQDQAQAGKHSPNLQYDKTLKPVT